MNELLKQIAENIPGIWKNEEYELILSLPPYNTFTFTHKTRGSVENIKGKYIVSLNDVSHFPILRLKWMVESVQQNQDYVINELSAFGNLTITNEGEEIQLTNWLPE